MIVETIASDLFQTIFNVCGSIFPFFNNFVQFTVTAMIILLDNVSIRVETRSLYGILIATTHMSIFNSEGIRVPKDNPMEFESAFVTFGLIVLPHHAFECSWCKIGFCVRFPSSSLVNNCNYVIVMSSA